MKKTTCLTSLLSAVLLISTSRELFVSAQGAPTGTVQKALIDYFLSMDQTPAPPPQNLPSSSSSSSGTQQQSPSLASTNTGSSGSFDLLNQLMQSPPQTTSSPMSSGGGFVGEPVMNSLSQMPSGSHTQETLQGSSGGSSSSPTDPFSMFNQVSGGASSPSGTSSNSMTFYNQLMQTMNQPPNHAGGSQPLSLPIPDPFPTTPAPVTLKPLPKVLPFVPPEWNLANSQNPHHQHQSMWGSGSGSGSGSSSSWGHSSVLPAHTAWAHHQRPQVPPPRDPPPHPMSQMMMIPRVRDMINNQAVQFGDLAYYQQHGCVDPTPTRPGPGGIRPTQTLWYGCQSRVSQMVCMRVGKRSGGKSGMTAMMMSMMNPTMTRALEKCLSPGAWSQMMLKGFSGGGMGGMGGMNPMLMMAMNGGGGGGLAGMLPMIMMMNQQNQPSPQPPSPASSPMPNSFTATPAKQTYPDPSGQNTLISQASRIPYGAAQPQTQSSGTSLMDSFASMLGLGSSNSQTSSPSQIPSGAALPGMSPASTGMNQAPSTSPGQVDCSSLMPLMMSRVMAAGEGMNSPEALEAIGELRKQYLPYSCQEMRLQYTGLPLRLCCPGRVDPPTIFDLFKAKNAGSA